MDPITLQVIYPIWIGIAFNLLLSVFNLLGMAFNLEGPFVEWYLEEKGFIKIMVSAWVIFLGWSVVNGITSL